MKKRILITDDEKNIRTTLNYCLTAEGFEIETASNGAEALNMILEQKKNYDLILLDIKMPDMDGMEVLRRLRATKNKTNIIMMTAYGTIKEAVEAMKLNAIDFISKPFTPEQIRMLVKKVFLREELEEEKLKTYEDYIEYAKLNIIRRKFEESENLLKIAIGKSVNSPEAHNLLGVIAECKGKIGEAQKQYRAALALDSSYEPAVSNLERITEMDYSNEDIKLG
ncbi:response regulator [Fusobacterium varium]|uniref:response regulator n=1 Tax=Fusobacterium varium TaxID=856 RepID=UPI000E4F551C|nr:response regulator [Fusobacterium varium]RHG38652.1 response regulator [Fusobacterium varium]